MLEWVFQAYAKLYWYPMFKLNLVDSKISYRFKISRHVRRIFWIERKIFHPNLAKWNFERIQLRAETRNFANFQVLISKSSVMNALKSRITWSFRKLQFILKIQKILEPFFKWINIRNQLIRKYQKFKFDKLFKTNRFFLLFHL